MESCDHAESIEWTIQIIGLLRWPENFLKDRMLDSMPSIREVAIALKGLIDLANQHAIDELCTQYFLQQLVAMPNMNVKVLRKKMHSKVIRRHDCWSDLTESEAATIRFRRW